MSKICNIKKDQCLNTHTRASLVDSRCRGFQVPGGKVLMGRRGSQGRQGRRERGANRLRRWSSSAQWGEIPQGVPQEMSGCCPNNWDAGWRRGRRRPARSKPRGSSPQQSSSPDAGEAGGLGAPASEAPPS